MATLTFRAEQALLGAMLRHPGLIGALDYLGPGDFMINQHRGVYTALASVFRLAGQDEWPGTGAVAEEAGPEADLAYLAELGRACPDPLHGRAYGSMVCEASAYRTLLADADELDSQASAIGDSSRRMFGAGVDGARYVEASAGYAQKVAEILRRCATQFSPDSISADAGPSASAADTRGMAEERVLAALIQQHRESREAMSLLSPKTFTHPLRREIFQAVRDLYLSGRRREIDALTVDWQTAANRGPANPSSTSPAPDDQPSYAARLAAVPATGPIAQTAYDLEHPPAGASNGQPRTVAALGRARLLQPPTAGPGRGPGPVQGM